MKSLIYILNALVGYILHFFYKEKDIWLIGGHAGKLYQDNSKVFYNYIKKNHEDINIYWVVDKNSKYMEEVKNKYKYIYKGSIKNYIYFLNSKIAIFSHSLSSDIAPYTYVIPLYKRKYDKILKVFLSHGIEAFKKKQCVKKLFTNMKDNILKGYNMQFAVSENEKQIKIKEWNINKEKIFVTGLTRYDMLNYDKYKPKHKILYMPTWRNWISKDNVEKSEYYKHIVGLLENRELLKLLENKNIQLNLYIHQLMQSCLNLNHIQLDKNIHVLSNDKDVQKEIIESMIIITDYSSIAWDSIYMKKPVLFYQFDKEKYLQEIGSYISFDSDIFIHRADNENDCIKEIENILMDKQNHNTEYEKIRNKYFKYTDNKNCQRVYDIIEEKLTKN